MNPIVPWPELRHHYEETIRKSFNRWIDPYSPHYDLNLSFSMGRIEEGRQLAAFFQGRSPFAPSEFSISVLETAA
jgi:hypothetical protein